jgi:glycosyl hydrolase family 16
MHADAELILDRSGYELEVEDTFDGPELDRRLWLPNYLPQWSSSAASAARYAVGGGRLRLRIEADQEPWNPEFDGGLRVSSIQTGVFAGALGSRVGQHRFRHDLVVREEQQNVALYTPRHGLFELTARVPDDPGVMVALWMIGYEDEPARSGEICICEIFADSVGATEARVGMGVHPFGDPTLVDDFDAQAIPIDARESHRYACRWTPSNVAFYVDDRLAKVVRQSPTYPMQFMLGIYEFPEGRSPAERYPKEFVVEGFRGYRPTTGRETLLRRTDR